MTLEFEKIDESDIKELTLEIMKTFEDYNDEDLEFLIIKLKKCSDDDASKLLSEYYKLGYGHCLFDLDRFCEMRGYVR